MPIVAFFQSPTLTRAKYEETVRRLTGGMRAWKSRPTGRWKDCSSFMWRGRHPMDSAWSTCGSLKRRSSGLGSDSTFHILHSLHDSHGATLRMESGERVSPREDPAGSHDGPELQSPASM